MAMKVKFANSPATELEYLEAREEPTYYDGSQRRCMTIYFDPAKVSLAQANELASNKAALTSLTFTNNNDPKSVITNIYDNYEVKMKVSQEPVLRGNDSVTGADIMVENVIMQLGRLTPMEIKFNQLLAAQKV